MTGNDSQIKLSITDNGIGVPAEYKDKIFEKFFRVPTGNLHNAKGYGLGLSYVAHVIKKHKGTINVESVTGNGSKFIICLPKHTEGLRA
jgi:two-component system phosphate regulon sensor histidine kinase PhoR